MSRNIKYIQFLWTITKKPNNEKWGVNWDYKKFVKNAKSLCASNEWHLIAERQRSCYSITRSSTSNLLMNTSFKKTFCRLNISHKMLLVSTTTAANEASIHRSIKSERDQTFFSFIQTTRLRYIYFSFLWAFCMHRLRTNNRKVLQTLGRMKIAYTLSKEDTANTNGRYY